MDNPDNQTQDNAERTPGTHTQIDAPIIGHTVSIGTHQTAQTINIHYHHYYYLNVYPHRNGEDEDMLSNSHIDPVIVERINNAIRQRVPNTAQLHMQNRQLTGHLVANRHNNDLSDYFCGLFRGCFPEFDSPSTSRGTYNALWLNTQLNEQNELSAVDANDHDANNNAASNGIPDYT